MRVKTKNFAIAILVTLMLIFLTLFGVSLKGKSAQAADAGNNYADALVESSVNTNYNLIRGSTYQLDSGFTASPKTIEALVRVGMGDNWYKSKGAIIGGNAIDGNEHFNLEISLDNKPRLWWRNGEIDHYFDYQVPMNEWVHIVVVRDNVTTPSNPQLVCYVNGTKVGSVAGIGTEMNVSASSPSPAHFIGRDAIVYNFFEGYINYVGVSSTAMTAQQVASAYNNCQRLVKAGQSGTMLAETCVPRTSYMTQETLSTIPNTLTATVCIDKKDTVGLNNSDQQIAITDKADPTVVGYILSTDAPGKSGSTSYNTFEVNVDKNGYIQVTWDPLLKGANGGEAVLTFDTRASGYTGSLDVRTGKKIHIAVVRNKSLGCFDLYLDGKHASTTQTNATVKTEMLPTFQIGIGRNRAANSQNLVFPGEIYDVALYGNAMTKSQIAAEYNVTDKTLINTAEYVRVIGNWVLDETQRDFHLYKNTNHVLKDYSGNGFDATVCTLADYFAPQTDDWFVAGEDEYTMIYVPDTQCTVRSNSVLTDAMFDWMVANKNAMNLQLVMGLGDIVDGLPLEISADELAKNPNYKTVAQQWQVMATNYEKLTSAGVPWSAIVGNHDYDENHLYSLTERKAGIYNQYFGYNSLTTEEKRTVIARYNTDTATTSANDMLNAIYEYTMTTKGGTAVKYLLVALEFGPSKAVLDWASEVIAQPQYKNHRVLFNTHSLVYSDGHFGDATATCNPSSYWYNLKGFVDGVTSTDGDFMWEHFISQNPNMFLTASGHIETSTNIFRKDKGAYGNTVMSMLCDGQGTDYFTMDGDDVSSWGDPLILVVKVNEKNKTLTYRYYNPVNNCFLGIENQFEISFADWGRSEIKAGAEISLEKDSVKAYDTVNFSVNKEAGYAYAKPVATANGETLSVRTTANGYSFMMPECSVEITVEKFALATITLPTTLTLKEGETFDLSEYLPEDVQFNFILDNDNAKVIEKELKGEKEGECVLTVSSDKFGDLCSIEITVEKGASQGNDPTQQNPTQKPPTVMMVGCGASMSLGGGALVLIAMATVAFVALKKKKAE